ELDTQLPGGRHAGVAVDHEVAAADLVDGDGGQVRARLHAAQNGAEVGGGGPGAERQEVRAELLRLPGAADNPPHADGPHANRHARHDAHTGGNIVVGKWVRWLRHEGGSGQVPSG